MTASRNTGLNSHFSPFFHRNYQSRAAFAIMAVICLLVSHADAKYGGGTGEPNNPYLIATPNDLNDIGNHPEDWGSHFVMVNDINLAEYTGTEYNMIGNDSNAFTGVFDGNGHTISNFTYVSTTGSAALFQHIDDANAVVKNLILIDPNIVARHLSGVLAGWLNNGTVFNCSIQGGSITATNYEAGGLVGIAGLGTVISSCYATCDVSGTAHTVGGLVGRNEGTIVNSYATGNVTGSQEVGGLVGTNGIGEVSNCYAAGDVEGIERVGGLVGTNPHGCISSSYSTGDVCGEYRTGGLIGDNQGDGCPVSHCYATGSVTGNELTGGLVGLNGNGGTLSNCYTTATVTGNNYTGGLIGANGDAVSSCYVLGAVDGNYVVGGLVGENAGEISNCYSIADVKGDDSVGGLLGTNDAIVSNSYSAGYVLGLSDYTGGLVGRNFIILPAYNNCYWDVTVNPSLDDFGHLPQPPDGEPPYESVMDRTTAELKQEATFVDWDFVEIWNIGENQTYPFLRTHPAGDLDHNDKVNFSDVGILCSHWLEEK